MFPNKRFILPMLFNLLVLASFSLFLIPAQNFLFVRPQSRETKFLETIEESVDEEGIATTRIRTDHLSKFPTFRVTLEKFPKNKKFLAVITVDQTGKGVFEYATRKNGKRVVDRMEFNVSQKQLEIMYFEVMRSGFPGIPTVLGNQKGYTGTIYRLTIDTGDTKKTVTVYQNLYQGRRTDIYWIVEGVLLNIPIEYSMHFDQA